MQKQTFNQKCYQILNKVPKGKLTTYKAIANKLNTKAYRAVGNAMNKNPRPFHNENLINSPHTPCHRVINSNGQFGGFASGLKNKIKLLKQEGIEIKNNKIDLKKYEHKL
ncbi:cysteine methyltransferase [Candidatus Pacearchaeota archaeon]|nr:cysteine methyltransferase [Candidatus Pacearchaeota archaeon]|tara:strand:+ start:4371 stop:4700 length:330 start_codon:yes stop_codon:yes gene_type:complete